jgi:hypothetical protein
MKDKIFYSFIIKHFSEQLHSYFVSRIPSIKYGPGSTVPLNKWVNVTGGNKVDAKGVIRGGEGSTKLKHYTTGWNDCAEEMKARVL